MLKLPGFKLEDQQRTSLFTTDFVIHGAEQGGRMRKHKVWSSAVHLFPFLGRFWSLQKYGLYDSSLGKTFKPNFNPAESGKAQRNWIVAERVTSFSGEGFFFFFLLTKKKEPWLLSTSDKNTTRSIVLCNWGAQVAAWGRHAPGARGRAEQGSLPGDWDHVKWNPQGECKADIREDLQQWVTTESEEKQILVVVHSSSLWPRTWIIFSQFHQWHPGDEKR